MSEDLIRYDVLTQNALRAMIAQLLDEVSRTGLPGEHHFFITFDTGFPGVKLSKRMKEKYPDEMTIVVQHRFWDMEIKDDYFQIGLSFDDIAELLVIPLASIKGFYDPSVKFGLQFEVQNMELESEPEVGKLEVVDNSKSKKSKVKKKTKPEMFEEPLTDDKNSDIVTPEKDNTEGAEVVSLDSFRKKK